jgi:predicted HTH transcriptional regulator
VSKHIAELIRQGEHQRLDFKHSISDSKKIARSLVAFANTSGGTLLIGVKDNGNVAGINSDEEYYMVETAAHLHCKPEIKFEVARWEVNGKVVLEIIVKENPKVLYKAPDKNGEWKVFFRSNDENLVASPLQVKVWNAIRYRKPLRLKLSKHDKVLRNQLKEKGQITVDQFCRIAFISHREAEETLVNFAVLGIVKLVSSDEGEHFKLVNL